MRRKLVKQGSATMMISLPSKWIKQNNLDKGDEINLEEDEGNLKISAIENKKKQIQINISTLTESSTRTLITSAYRLGYDYVIVNYQNSESLELIKKIVDNNLLGFEIITVEKNKCIIENITEPSIEQFENILSKVFLNIESLFESAINQTKEYELIENKIIQFDNFCRRVITKKGNLLEDSFHSSINRGQREIYHLIKLNQKLKPETINLIKESQEIFFLLKESYIKKDIKLIEKLHETYKNFEKKIKNHFQKEQIAIHNILSATRQFYLATSPLTGMLLKN